MATEKNHSTMATEENHSTMATEVKTSKTDVVKYSFQEYISYILLIVLYTATVWLLGNNNHQYLKLWFAGVMTGLLLLRIPDFIKRKYYHFFLEMCYFVNLATIFMLLFDIDIKYIYPFLHGPLLVFAVVSGDAFIPHNLPRTTSFAIHTVGTVISRRLYWHTVDIANENVFDIEVFQTCFSRSFLLYLCWFLPYSCYVFMYNGKSTTMLKNTLKLNRDRVVSNFTKVKYLFGHMFATIVALSLGTILMNSHLLDNIFVCFQIFSGIVQGAYYYYAGGKKLKWFDVFRSTGIKAKSA